MSRGFGARKHGWMDGWQKPARYFLTRDVPVSPACFFFFLSLCLSVPSILGMRWLECAEEKGMKAWGCDTEKSVFYLFIYLFLDTFILVSTSLMSCFFILLWIVYNKAVAWDHFLINWQLISSAINKIFIKINNHSKHLLMTLSRDCNCY